MNVSDLRSAGFSDDEIKGYLGNAGFSDDEIAGFVGAKPKTGLASARHGATWTWEDPSAIKELGRGFVEGLMSTPETVGTIAKIAGSNRVGPAIEKKSRAIADKYRMPDELSGKVAEDLSLLAEPAWWTHGIGQMVGSMIGPVGAGGGAFKVTKAVLNKILRNPKTVAKAAKYIGVGVGGTTGGAMEGTSTYNQVLEETGDEQKALRSGALMAVGSAVLNSASFGSMLSPKIKSKILRVVTSGLIEGATEQAEEPWEALVTGKPEEAVQRWIDGFNVFFPAMVTGGLGGGIASLASARGENKVFTKDEEDEINGALSSALEEVEIPNVLRNVQRGMDATKKVYEGPTPVLNGQPAALEPDLVDANGRPLRTETARQKPGFMRTASDLVDLRKADEAEGPGIIQQPGVPSAPRESTTYPKQSMFVVRKKGEGPVPEAPVMGDVIVENKPLATAKGKPFKTEVNARKRMQKLGFTPETHDIIPVEGGFVIQEKGRTIPGSDIQPGVSKGSSLFKNGKRRTAEVSGIAIPEKPAMPSQPKTASVKMMITRKDKADLRNLGYTDEDIYAMKPEDAGRILEAKAPKVPEAASKPVNPRALREIDKAVRKGRTDEGTARLARHLLTLDPSFDTNSSLEISNAVRKADPEIVRREGLDPTKSYTIMGETLSYHEGGVLRTAISLFKGHDADTLVEEWYHRYYERLTPQEQKAYLDYHKASGDARSPHEHFAQEGRDFFFSDKLHEKAGGIRQIFEEARDTLKAMIGRIRVLRGANVPEKIQAMYRSAGSRYEEVTGKARGRKTVSHQLRKDEKPDTISPVTSKKGPGDKTTEATPQPDGGTAPEIGYRKTKGKDAVGRDIPDWSGATVYHATSENGYKDILAKGYRILGAEAEDGQGGYYGEAVSFTPTKSYAEQFGEKLTVAKLPEDIRILNLNDPKDWDTYRKITNGGNDLSKLRAQITKAGYDGIYDAGAGDLFLHNPEKAKLISNSFNQSRPSDEGGKPSYQLRDVTDTPEFKKWFGDSKVVDKNGKPLVVYHHGSFVEDEDIPAGPMHFGTKQAAQERSLGKYKDDVAMQVRAYQNEEGVWHWDDGNGVTSEDLGIDGYEDEDSAIAYGRSQALSEIDDFAIDVDGLGGMTAAYLSMSNPKRVTDAGGANGEWSTIIEQAKREGHDGIVYRNQYEDKGKDSYIAFSPTQIKSVNNVGTFDPKNPDIRYQIRHTYRDKVEDLAKEKSPRGRLAKTALDTQDKIDAMREKGSSLRQYNPDKKWIEDNEEYIASTDPDLLCQKSEGCDIAIRKLKTLLGRKVYNANNLGWEVLARAAERGLKIPCPQCYVYWARKADGSLMQKKFIIGVGGYNGEITRWKESTLDKLRTRGLRHYSSTDFKAEHIPGMIIEAIESQENGVPMVGYTKEADAVELFGPAGAYFNVSIGRNRQIGTDHKIAKALRKKHENVSTVFIGFNDAEILAALRDPEIDRVIPWHSSGAKASEMKKIIRGEDVKDYTATQNETIIKTNDKGKKVRVKAPRQIHEIEHGGDLDTYLKLVKKNKVTKKFPEIYDLLGEEEKPLYMKLIGPEYGKFSEGRRDLGGGRLYLPPDAAKIDTKLIPGIIQRREAQAKADLGSYTQIADEIAAEIQAGTFEPADEVVVAQGDLAVENSFRKRIADAKKGIKRRASYQIRAWHGSPSKHDKFSTDYIGTGEGAQAYGHGLYFAGSKEVGEYYKTALERKQKRDLLVSEDEAVRTITRRKNDAHNEQGFDDIETEDGIKHWISMFGDDYSRSFEAMIKSGAANEKLFDGILGPKKKGHLYEVELAPEEDDYLLWDKPLSEQSEKVKEALEKAQTARLENNYDAEKIREDFEENGPLGYGADRFDRALDEAIKYGGYGSEFGADVWAELEEAAPNASGYIRELKKASFKNTLDPTVDTGESIYKGFASEKGDDRSASEYLHSLGIRGIKYLDGMSRGKGEGSYNYVIFSDEDVSIKARFQLRESGRVVTYTELEEHEIPEETQVVYKLMRITGLSKKHLLPLYARPEEGPVQGFEIGKWYKAESQRPSIGGRLLAHRPGIHAVDLPIFSQGRAKVKGEKRVWVEALMPAMDPKTQAESDATPALPNGQRQGIRERVIGPNEAYNFRTNPSATGAGAWPIAGSMKIGRLLSDEDVERILRDHGAQEHIENSLTGVKPDMVERMNAKGSFQLREEKAPAWYSSLAKAVESPKFPNRAPAKQMSDVLKSWAKSGEIKQEELDWSGILDRLAEEKDDARWTKDMVLEYLRENNVQIEEVMKGGQTAAESENVAKIADIIEQYDADISDKIYELWKDGRNYEAIDGLLYQFYDKAPEEAVNQVDDLWVNGVVARASKEPRHARWVLPGGKNYRELLLTMPAKARASNLEEAFRQWKADAHAGKRGVYSPKEIDNMTLGDVENILLEEYMRPQRGNEFYNRTHFDEPNILTHVRFNERTDADGKRVLFLEEIQSDWHQTGRDRGYKKELTSEEKESLERLEKIRINANLSGDFEKARFAERQIAALGGFGTTRVPDAPFKKSWPMFAFKRMVRWAAENGFERIAWTTGEQQAERYDLSKQVDSVRIARRTMAGGAYKYDVYVKQNGRVLITKDRISDAEMADVIGKDLAKKAVEDLAGLKTDKEYSGLDLKVGGEGMKGFYDQILPAEVNKFFNKGKWGNAKVGETSIRESAPDRTWTVIDEDGNESLSFGRKEDAEEYLEYKGWIYGSIKPPSPGTSRVHSLDITPQMREKALSEGMPMFQLREAKGPDVEEVKSIFEDKGIAPRPVQKKGKVSLFARNVARAVQVRPREILKKESPEASFEPVRRYEQTISDERSMAGNWMTDFDEALAGLSRADRKWALAGFKDIYEKGGKMPNPRLQKFADAWDKIQNEIGDMAIRFGILEKYRVTEYVVKKGARSVRVFDTEKEAGAFIAESKNADALTIVPRDSTRIRVFTKIRNYFPHILTPEAREALRTQRGELYDALVKAAHTAGFDLAPYMEDLDVKNMVRRNANLENARQARLPSFVETSQGRVQVLEMDPFKVLPSIIEGASRRLAFVKNWSPRPGEALKMHETIRNNIAHESGSENAFVWDYLWQDMQGRTLDEFYNGLSGDIRQVLNTGATIANSAMLTGAQVTNLIVGPLPGMSRFGTWNMTKSASRLLAHKLFRGKMAKTAAELDRFRREGGWAKETMSFTGETEDVHKSIGGMASNFLKLTGMEAANRFLNKMSNFAANYALADAIAGLRNPRTGAFRKAWGMDPGGLREFLKKEGEWTDADIDRMVQDGVTPEDHARFIQKSSTNTNIYRERANTRPEFMARNGFWRRVFSFTSPLRMVGSTVADAVNYAKKGNMRPLITLIIGAPLLGLANNDVKDFLKGVIKKEDENKDDLNTFAGKVLDALAESGIMGMPGSVVSDIRWWAKKGGAPLTIPAAEWWGDLSYGMYRAATKGYSEGLDEGAKQAYYTMIKKVPIFRAIDHQVGGPYTQYLERYRNGGARRQRARRPRRSRRESR